MTESSESYALTGRLQRFYLAAAENLAETIQRNGQPLSVQVEQMVVVGREDPEDFRVEERPVTRNILDHRLPPSWGSSEALLSDELTAEALEIAGEIASLPDAQLPFFSLFNGAVLIKKRWNQTHSFHDDPANWTRGQVILPALRAHLVSLPSLDEATAQHAESFARDILQFVIATQMTYRTVVPIAGILIDADQVALKLSEDARLRRVTPDEENELAETVLRDPFMEYSLPWCALEVDCVTGRRDQNPDTQPLVEPWLGAFQLQGRRMAGVFATTKTFPEWAGLGTFYASYNLSKRAEHWSVVSETDAGDLARLVQEIKKVDLKNKKTATHALALHRYQLGMAKSDPVESLLDFVIALEAVLLPRDSQVGHSDLSYRFKVHGAHYLGATAAERHNVYKRMGELYNHRSTLVHGGKYPEPSTITAARDDAEKFARKALNRALREGFPGPQTFIDLVLGEWSEGSTELPPGP